MSKTYRNPILFSLSALVGVLIVLFIIEAAVKILLTDLIFMAGLLIFITGGFLWLIEKGIYSRFFKDFKKLLKRTSKMESYVRNHEVELIEMDKGEDRQSIPLYILLLGLTLIVISIFLAIL